MFTPALRVRTNCSRQSIYPTLNFKSIHTIKPLYNENQPPHVYFFNYISVHYVDSRLSVKSLVLTGWWALHPETKLDTGAHSNIQQDKQDVRHAPCLLIARCKQNRCVSYLGQGYRAGGERELRVQDRRGVRASNVEHLYLQGWAPGPGGCLTGKWCLRCWSTHPLPLTDAPSIEINVYRLT